MPGKTLTARVVTAFVLIGTVCVGLRYHARRELRSGRGDTVWRLTYEIECEAERAGARIQAAFPRDTRHCRVFRQDFRSPHLRIDRLHLPTSETREVVAVARQAGEYNLTLRFDLHLSPRANWPTDDVPVVFTPEARAKYLQSENEIQVTSDAVVETLKSLRREAASKSDLLGRLFEYCRSEIALGREHAPGDAEGALRRLVARPLGRARAMVALCRASNIPARLVTGFQIREGHHPAPHIWVEVLSNDHWVPYDPDYGFWRELPGDFLAVRRGDVQIIHTRGVSELESRFTIVQLPAAPEGMASSGGHLVEIFDLTRLPLEMHEVLSLILLMPLGALATCIFRNIIGIETSGRFTPTLLALSFVFADWRTGLVVFATVIILGFTSRRLLDRLKLLMLPRLSVILTLVVWCIVFGISLLSYYHLTPGAHAVLLPMVILTMIIERFFVTTQEDGMRVAVQRLAGTLLVGSVCYVLLRWETVARLLLIYPEAHWFTIALLIMLGRYTGYQLTELWRFRDLVKMEP